MMEISFVDFMPLNHYVRENNRYLRTIQQGASIIYEANDGNASLDDWRAPPFAAQAERRIQGGFLKYLKVFMSARIWPRGFPLDQLGNDTNMSCAARSFSPTVWQRLIGGELGVDAIYRLAGSSPVTLKQRDPLAASTFR